MCLALFCNSLERYRRDFIRINSILPQYYALKMDFLNDTPKKVWLKVSYYTETERKKERFIAVISNGKWYYFMLKSMVIVNTSFSSGCILVYLRAKSPVFLNTIATLQIGEKGIVSEESLDRIPLKLLEMGCLPGVEVELLQIAPLKDPMYIRVNGSYLAIRRETARQITVAKI